MPSTTHRRVAAIAIASMLALISLSADALAKTSHSRSRAASAAASAAAQSAPAGGSYDPHGRSIPPYPTGLVGRGNVLDNTAGWGDVGAR